MNLRPLLPALCALAVASTGAAPGALQAQPREAAEVIYNQAISLRVLEETPTGFRLEITNPGVPSTDEPLRRIVQSFFVLTTPDGRCDVKVEELQWRIDWEDGEQETGLGLESETTAGPPPVSFTRPTARYLDQMRSLGFVQVKATMTSALNSREQPGRRGTGVVERLVLAFDLGENSLTPPESAEPLAQRDPYLLKFAGLAAVNAMQADKLSRMPLPSAAKGAERNWITALGDARENGPVLLFTPAREGFYRIDQTDLARASTRAAELDPAALRVFVGDQEIPTVASGPSLASGGVLHFYVPPKAEANHPHVPVWVMQPGPEGIAALGLEAEPRRVAPAPPVGADTPEAEDFQIESRVDLFRPNEFRPDGYSDETGRWALARVGMRSTHRVEFEVEGLLASDPATLRVSLSPEKPQDAVSAVFYLNGIEVGRRENLSGRGPFGITVEVPPGILREGPNVLATHYPESLEPRMGAGVFLNGATIDYPVDAENAPINRAITLKGGGTAAAQVRFARGGTAGGQPGMLLDVTDPANPTTVGTSRASLTAEGANYTVRLTRTPADRRLFFGDPDSCSYLAAGRDVDVDDVTDAPQGVDYLVIAHADAMDAARRLAEYRRSPTRRTMVVDVEDVFACFGRGEATSDAIHAYLQHALDEFPGRRLSQVVLVGEASDYWWPNEFPRDDVSPNQVPVFRTSDKQQKIRGDNGYGLLSGRGDLQDVQLGRIPAATGAELDSFIDRLIAYETAPPDGPWRSRHVFVTDDEPEFARVAERLIETELTGVHVPRRIYLQDFPYEDYFRIFLRKRSSEMTRAIIDAMSDGALTMTYLGHGGPNLWSGERIFHYRDLPLVDTGGRRPIMAAASCDTAWIDYPVDPVKQSLGEQFILTPNGGGMAVFAPVAGTSSFEHDYLIRPFYRALLDPAVGELGVMAEYAKAKYLLERNQGYVSEQFVLLGDPATRPPMPSGAMDLRADPGVLFSTQSASIKIEGAAPTAPWGMAEARLLDPVARMIGEPVRVPVRDGRFALELPAPATLRPGAHRVVVQAWNAGLGAFETLSFGIPVLAPQIAVRWEATPPPTEDIQAGQPVRVELQALNESTALMQALVLKVRDVTADEELASLPLALEPGVMRRWAFEMEAPAGVLVLEARVEEEGASEFAAPLVSVPLELRGVAPDAPPVQVVPSLVGVTRQAAPESTTFEVPVYNVSAGSISELSARLFLMDQEAGTPVGTELRGESIPPRGSAVFRFRADTLFPEGDLPFRLDLRATLESGEAVEASLPLPLEVPVGTDVEVVPGSVRAERDAYVQGQTVHVRATVRNTGPTPVGSLSTALYVDYPWVDSARANSVVGDARVVFEEDLLPGETRDVRLRWDPAPSSSLDARLYVVTNNDESTPEVNLRNNVGDVLMNRLRLPNLSLDRGGLALSRRFATPGDPVTATIPYVNNSPYDFAHPFVVEVNATGQGVPPQLVYRGTFDKLDAAERGAIQATWIADGVRNRLAISLNEDREYGETTAGDNNASLEIDYVFPLSAAATGDGRHDFSRLLEQGDMLDSTMGPRDSLTLASYPRIGRRMPFSNDHVVGPALPEESRRTEADNLVALTSEGALSWTPYERPENVRLRIPLDRDDGTTLYDVHVHHLATNNIDEKPFSHYRFRFEDNLAWTENLVRDRPNAYLGRVETQDDWLDIEIGPTTVPAWNLLLALDVRPLRGVHLSPLIELPGPSTHRFTAEVEVPEGTRLLFEHRVGDGSRAEPRLGPWTEIHPGDLVNFERGTTFVQWRVTMVGSKDAAPEVFRYGLEPLGDASAIAGSQ